MANEISIYEPRYLAEVVRTTPLVRTFFLDNYFTNVKTFATKSVDIDVVKGDRRMASFVHPLVGGQVLKNEGYQTESFTPPLINPLTVTTANDALERMPGEDLYSGMTPEERAAKQLIEDYQRLNDAATRREEWMAVRTIMDGQIPIVGPGVNKVIDFGFTNKVTLEGTKKWGASAAKPLDDLEDWVDQVLENGFANVDHVVMGKTALRNFLADTNVQNMLDNRRIELGIINPKDLPNGARYIGHLSKPSLDIYTYGEVYLDDWTNPSAPVTKRLVDDNKIALLPSNPNFMRAYGLTSYIDDAKRTITAQTNRLLRTYVKHGTNSVLILCRLQRICSPPGRTEKMVQQALCTKSLRRSRNRTSTSRLRPSRHCLDSGPLRAFQKLWATCLRSRMPCLWLVIPAHTAAAWRKNCLFVWTLAKR